MEPDCFPGSPPRRRWEAVVVVVMMPVVVFDMISLSLNATFQHTELIVDCDAGMLARNPLFWL